MDEYDTLVSKARGIQHQIREDTENASRSRLDLLLLLVDMKSQEVIWRTRHNSWASVLRVEKLATVATFTKFERGLKLLGIEDVTKFGPTATCAIASAKMSYRTRLIRKTRRWVSKNKSATHEEVSRFVWRTKRSLNPEESVSRGRLLLYIEDLKAALRKRGVRPPRMR